MEVASMAMLSAEDVDALTQIDSPTVSNAIETFQVRDPTAGYASMELRCQFPTLKPMVGYAFTVTADSTSPLPKRENREPALFEAVRNAPRPVVVVIKDVGPQRLRSCHAGDVLCSVFRKLGAVGLVTDGGVRDVAGIANRAPGFQVFTPGLTVSHGVPTFLEFEPVVSICGLTIRSGDLLHGDANGLLVIPHDVASQVAAQARSILDKERRIIEFIDGDSFSLDGLAKLLYH
jgi:regulator of RNase E activity RraA